MATLNLNYRQLAAGYLFPEIARRTKTFQIEHPGVKVMRLGIGDTKLPLTPTVVQAMHAAVNGLSRQETYSGYGDEQSNKPLREAISRWYATIGAKVEPDEIFVSDGAKPDTANLQSIFGIDNAVAVQDPAYPVYVDTNVIAGRGGRWENGRYTGITYMPCTPENSFFPELPGNTDLIYFCSPNNPTGAVATRKQLEQLVRHAEETDAVIIFDAAYQAYIRDPALPRSIYQVPGAKKRAIEVNSFSKWAGFTGVRLGWTVAPHELKTAQSGEGEIRKMWNRRQCTFFNEASNIAQAGGLAVLSTQGLAESQGLVDHYMENARIIREGLQSIGIQVYGGENAPFLWMQTPNRMPSWQFFDKLLKEAHVVCTPGAGFGPSGEGYARLSAFGLREGIEAAVESIKKNLKVNAA